jgi:ABC-type branched-subunit amino acid transport system permease subunit
MSNETDTESKRKNPFRNLPSIIWENKMLMAVVAFFYMLPLGTTASTSPVRALLFLITQILIFSLLAMSFDLQLGRAGLLNFGHVAFFGVGAYFIAFALDVYIPQPIALIIAVAGGAGLGLIMGLTTSRMRGTAFAFIALAIAMFIYNFMAENPDISGGETGLRITTPGIFRTAPTYLVFVSIGVIFIAAFLGVAALYLKKRTDTMGLVLFTPVMIAFVGVLLLFGTNIIGPAIVLAAFLGMIVIYWMEKRSEVSDPLTYSDREQSLTGETRPMGLLTSYFPVLVVAIALIGVLVTFGANIIEMVFLWIDRSQTFFYTIPVQYYLALTSVVFTYIFIKRLVASPFGRMVAAVAQNEERAEALGYNSYMTKIMVLVISGAIAGLGGALYAPFIRTIDPHTALGVEVTINAMLYTIIGGIGTLLGPLVGTGIVEYSELYLVDFIRDGLNLPGELWLVGLGLIYIIIVLFMSLGIVGTIRSKAVPIKEKLRRMKIGQLEVGIKEDDYWVFALLGMIGLFLLLLGISLIL